MRCQSEKLVIVFYGPDFGNVCLRDALTTWWNWTDGVCRTLDIAPTHIAGTFGDKPNRLKEYYTYSMKRSKSRFQEQLETDNVMWFALDVLDDRKAYIAFDWTLTSSCGLCKRGGRALFGLDCDAVSLWDAHTLASFMKQCLESANCIRINYGFATIMPRDFLPAGYAVGITTDAAGARLSYDTTAWCRYAERECGHVLRNLYGWNILTPAHLAIDIGGTPLKNWINASPKRGKLYEIAPPLWCWSFEDITEGKEYLKWECEPVEAIRRELEGYQLFPWQTIH